MLESTFLLVGLTAILATGVALFTFDDVLAMIAGIAGFISWGLIAYGSLDVRVVGDSTTYSFTQPSITIWAAMLSLIPLYIALTGPLEVVNRFRRANQDNI